MKPWAAEAVARATTANAATEIPSSRLPDAMASLWRRTAHAMDQDNDNDDESSSSSSKKGKSKAKKGKKRSSDDAGLNDDDDHEAPNIPAVSKTVIYRILRWLLILMTWKIKNSVRIVGVGRTKSATSSN